MDVEPEGWTAMLPGWVACAPVLSVTFTTNVKVPAVLGAPEMEAGGDEESVRPGGSCPEAMDQV